MRRSTSVCVRADSLIGSSRAAGTRSPTSDDTIRTCRRVVGSSVAVGGPISCRTSVGVHVVHVGRSSATAGPTRSPLAGLSERGRRHPSRRTRASPCRSRSSARREACRSESRLVAAGQQPAHALAPRADHRLRRRLGCASSPSPASRQEPAPLTPGRHARALPFGAFRRPRARTRRGVRTTAARELGTPRQAWVLAQVADHPARPSVVPSMDPVPQLSLAGLVVVVRMPSMLRPRAPQGGDDCTAHHLLRTIERLGNGSIERPSGSASPSGAAEQS